jgi:hypothetical protein
MGVRFYLEALVRPREEAFNAWVQRADLIGKGGTVGKFNRAHAGSGYGSIPTIWNCNRADAVWPKVARPDLFLIVLSVDYRFARPTWRCMVGSKAAHVDCRTPVSNLLILGIEHTHYADVTSCHRVGFSPHDGKFNDCRSRSQHRQISHLETIRTDSQRQSTGIYIVRAELINTNYMNRRTTSQSSRTLTLLDHFAPFAAKSRFESTVVRLASESGLSDLSVSTRPAKTASKRRTHGCQKGCTSLAHRADQLQHRD